MKYYLFFDDKTLPGAFKPYLPGGDKEGETSDWLYTGATLHPATGLAVNVLKRWICEVEALEPVVTDHAGISGWTSGDYTEEWYSTRVYRIYERGDYGDYDGSQRGDYDGSRYKADKVRIKKIYELTEEHARRLAMHYADMVLSSECSGFDQEARALLAKVGEMAEGNEPDYRWLKRFLSSKPPNLSLPCHGEPIYLCAWL